MGARHHSIQRRFLNSEQNKNLVHFDKLGKQGRTGLSKGLAKLGNIVAETMFLVMFPEGWLNICFGRKICVGSKMFLTPDKNIFCFLSSKICFRNTCFPHG